MTKDDTDQTYEQYGIKNRLTGRVITNVNGRPEDIVDDFYYQDNRLARAGMSREDLVLVSRTVHDVRTYTEWIEEEQ